MSLDGCTQTQLVPKTLLQVSVLELHNSMVSPPSHGGIKEAIDADNYFSISDYMPRTIFLLQTKNMYSWHELMCDCK